MLFVALIETAKGIVFDEFKVPFLQHVDIFIFPDKSHFREKFISVEERFEKISLFWMVFQLTHLTLLGVTTAILRWIGSKCICHDVCVVIVIVRLRYLQIMATSTSIVKADWGFNLVWVIKREIVVLSTCDAAARKAS